MVYTQQRKKILRSLVKEINEFDCYYEMSDSSIKYSNGCDNKIKIESKLKDLIFSEKQSIVSRLNENGKICWKRYFNK